MKRSGKALDPSSYAQQPSGSKETQHAQHAQRQPSISKETQTVMPFPQRLQISVPIHCATVKAVSTELSDNPERVPQDDDTWLPLAVSIRDSSSGVPLSCVVALQGEELTTPKGQMICFLSLKIDVVGDDQSQKIFPKPEILKLHTSFSGIQRVSLLQMERQPFRFASFLQMQTTSSH